MSNECRDKIMLYTFYTFHNSVIDIRQITAPDTNSAVLIWRRSLPFPTAYDEHIEDDDFTAVEGTVNCWCTTCLDASENLVMADLVLTVAESTL